MFNTEKLVKNIIGDEDDIIEDTLEKQFSLKDDKESENKCKKRRK